MEDLSLMIDGKINYFMSAEPIANPSNIHRIIAEIKSIPDNAGTHKQQALEQGILGHFRVSA